MAQAVQEPEGGIDNTLAAAFAQVRQQVAEQDAASSADAAPEPETVEPEAAEPELEAVAAPEPETIEPEAAEPEPEAVAAAADPRPWSRRPSSPSRRRSPRPSPSRRA